MPKLPEDPKPILNAMAALLKRDGHENFVVVLDQAEPTLEWYREDWGIRYYKIVLSLPFDVYAAIDERHQEYERLLGAYAETATRGCAKERVDSVFLAPNLDATDDWHSGARPLSVPVQDADRIWKPGHFRLFISHVSTHKVKMSELRDSMAKRYISAFVAHEDIEPCREWQDEIRLALASCHAMLAYVTPDFHSSIWCMQEVGWALGRGVLLVPVKAPDDPKGFMGIGQAMRIPGKANYELRDALVDLFWKNDRTHRQMHEPAVLAVEKAAKKQAAKIAVKMIGSANGLLEEHAKRLLAATTANAHIVSQPEVAAELRKLAATVGVQPTLTSNATDEYDPFADE